MIVHDELDLPPTVVRVKAGGGLAGHNGLRSIAAHLGTQDFLRVRIGVGKPPSKERGADHVLSRLPAKQRELYDVAVQEAADAVELIVTDSVDAAMRRYNGGMPEGDTIRRLAERINRRFAGQRCERSRHPRPAPRPTSTSPAPCCSRPTPTASTC